MNICNFVNIIICMIDYTLHGEPTPKRLMFREVSLAELVLWVSAGVFWVLFIVWWLAPIQYFTRNIKFRCN